MWGGADRNLDKLISEFPALRALRKFGQKPPRGPGDRKISFSLERTKKNSPTHDNNHSRFDSVLRIESLVFSILPLEIELFQSAGPLGKG